MSDQQTITLEQMIAATYRVSMENNAMLRIILNNQSQIIAKMKIVLPINNDMVADLAHGSKMDEESLTQLFIKQSELIANMLQKKSWEWATMNLDITDNEKSG